jgi:hypothetical protein
MKNIFYTGLLAVVLVSCNTSKTATETRQRHQKKKKLQSLQKVIELKNLPPQQNLPYLQGLHLK